MPLPKYWAHIYLHFQRLSEFVTSDSKQYQAELLHYYSILLSYLVDLSAFPYEEIKTVSCCMPLKDINIHGIYRHH
jgi:hypothetical protein